MWFSDAWYERVGTGSDSDWVLLRLGNRTPVATALGTDKTKNPVAIAPGSDMLRQFNLGPYFDLVFRCGVRLHLQIQVYR